MLVECLFAISPQQTPNITKLLLLIENGSSMAVTSADRIPRANASVVFNDTAKHVNGSYCNIVSLEVYRGREQAIEISYNGLSLSDTGTIEVSMHSQEIDR